MLIEDFKKDISNFLKEIQESTSKQVEALKEETQKSYQKKPRLLGIIKIQFSHHSKSWISQHTRKARFGFKITSNDAGRGF